LRIRIPPLSFINELETPHGGFSVDLESLVKFPVEIVKCCAFEIPRATGLADGTGTAQVIPVGTALLVIHLPAPHAPPDCPLSGYGP
jgi:hypothetical protein